MMSPIPASILSLAELARIDLADAQLEREAQAELDAALREYENEFVTGERWRDAWAARVDARRRRWGGWGVLIEGDPELLP